MFHSRLNRSDAEVLVAQVCDLPYRRLAAGRVSLRRLASAGCKPAIRQTGGLRYAFGVADAYEMFRLGVKLSEVYLAKYKVAALVKKEIRAMEEQAG